MLTSGQADPKLEKRDAFESARRLLDEQDDTVLRYAVLELRRCLEAVVYEKLIAYRNFLPEDSVNRWQAPQAFDALVEIEPHAEESLTCAVSVQKSETELSSGPYVNIGVDERPKAKWLKKTWNSLGSHLHAEWPFSKSRETRRPLRPDLEKIIEALSPLVANSLTMTMFNAISFPCAGCGRVVGVMDRAVEANRTAVCLSCGFRHRAEKGEQQFTFFPDEPLFHCECGKETFIPGRSIEIGFRFTCPACSQEVEFTSFDWKYRPLKNADAVNAAPDSPGTPFDPR